MLGDFDIELLRYTFPDSCPAAVDNWRWWSIQRESAAYYEMIDDANRFMRRADCVALAKRTAPWPIGGKSDA